VTEDQLRDLLLREYSDIAVRVVALVVALLLFLGVFEAVRRRRISEALTPIWVSCAFGVLVLAVEPRLLESLTRLIGAWTLSSTVFFFGLLFLVALSLVYAVVLTRLGRQVTRLAQEVALLRERVPRDDDPVRDENDPRA
jgi:hypothetical protein